MLIVCKISASRTVDDEKGRVHLKVVMLGDANIGAKTNLILRYVKGVNSETEPSTVGASFMAKDVDVDSVTYHLEIWGLHLADS